MKTTGVSGIPKFGLWDFLGHPTAYTAYIANTTYTAYIACTAHTASTAFTA